VALLTVTWNRPFLVATSWAGPTPRGHARRASHKQTIMLSFRSVFLEAGVHLQRAHRVEGPAVTNCYARFQCLVNQRALEPEVYTDFFFTACEFAPRPALGRNGLMPISERNSSPTGVS
jgi:hypothetical protein